MWEVLDNYLKGVLPLEAELTFDLFRRVAIFTIQYLDQQNSISIVFVYATSEDPFLTNPVCLIEESGMEAIWWP